jgi:predicted PurR-regulated permease PerM
MPLGFAAFVSFLLLPVCSWFETFIPSKIASVILTMFILLLAVAGLLTALGAQIFDLFKSLPGIGENLKAGALEAFHVVNEQFPFTQDSAEDWLEQSITSFSNELSRFIGSSISASASIVLSLSLIIIYTFLMLLYRSAFKQFFLIQFNKKHREEAVSYLENVRVVSQGYIYGVLLVMLIIAVLYSVGFYFIDIKYAVFWGLLGGTLVFIPYLGTFLGGLLPFLYAIVTTDTIWQPLTIVALVYVVQVIEGNLITPRVVGKAVGINPLFSIISIILGGTVWGIPGIILAIPFIGIVKITLAEFDRFKPFQILLGTEIYHGEDALEAIYDEDRYRILEEE